MHRASLTHGLTPVLTLAHGLALALALAACDPGVRLGSSCERSSECPSPLVCGFGRCRTECVVNRDCPLEALCLLDDSGNGRCSLADDPDCREPGTTCPSGLACIGGECVDACETVAECPADAQCVPVADGRARCVRADGDAGAPDAGDAALDGGACAGPGCDRVVELAAAASATCARTASGAVYCWGGDAIGDGNLAHLDCGGRDCQPSPVRVRMQVRPSALTDLGGPSFIAAGGRNACARMPDARVVCWGAAYDGQSGTGQPTGEFAEHVRLAGGGTLSGIDTVTVGGGFTIASGAGQDWGWGYDPNGELADGTRTHHHDLAIPTAVGPYDAISLGNTHGCALSAGAVRCWGENDLGQTGDPTVGEGIAVLVPAVVADLPPVQEISVGYDVSCATDRHDVWCWGWSYSLGVFMPPTTCGGSADSRCSATPVRTYREPAVDYVSLSRGANAHELCAIDANGRAWCWGLNDSGVAGPLGAWVGEPILRTDLPQPIDSIVIGLGHACALALGDVWCWGDGSYGALGRGDLESDVVAQRVAW